MNLRNLFIAFFILLAYSCRHDKSCDELFSKNLPVDRTVHVPIARLTDGYDMPIDNDFDFSCIFYNNKEISNHINFKRVNDETVSLKILNPDDLPFRDKDTLKLFFVDHRWFMWEMSSKKVVNVIIQKAQTPCDSITNIIYRSIAGKVNELKAKETEIIVNKNMDIKEVFDITLQEQIRNYISGLKGPQEKEFEACQKKYFVLDLTKQEAKSGFEQNKYFLPENLQKYLNAVAGSIAFEVSKHTWAKSRFVIQCEGYADQQRYTGPSTIDYKQIGIPYSKVSGIVASDCGFATPFAMLDAPAQADDDLTGVKDNCDLSTLRSYASVVYLKKQLSKICSTQFIFQYRGKGVCQGPVLAINRRIDLFLELKAVSNN